MDVRQKNLKLTEKSIELLRFLAYQEETTESEVVEQALVKGIALKVSEKLQIANRAPIDGDDGEYVVEARYMAQQLQKHDPKRHWRVVRNGQGFWELQHAKPGGRTKDEVLETDWEPWPWGGATTPQAEAEVEEEDDLDSILIENE